MSQNKTENVRMETEESARRRIKFLEYLELHMTSKYLDKRIPYNIWMQDGSIWKENKIE